MEYDLDITLLSNDFLKKYPKNLYPEILHKPGRPYSCLLLEYYDEFFICVPFRSHINHKNAYLFKNSARSRKSSSGLDYSKSVIIKDIKYLDNSPAIVDKDEYKEMVSHIARITHEVCNYVSGYINHVNKTKVLHNKEFHRKYAYSTLKYFHDVMKI